MMDGVTMVCSISIHALREEGDWSQLLTTDGVHPFLSTPSARRATHGLLRGGGDAVISIHALREEGDGLIAKIGSLIISFLSTPSARRATYYRGIGRADIEISIHALREEGDRLPHVGQGRKRYISIHALREEGDVPFRLPVFRYL